MLWIKAFHIIAVVCWFSGIFYLPRLFVYHAMAEDNTGHERFIVMERKLFWGIMTPSAVATVALGAWLIGLNPGYFMAAPWMHAKLTLVMLVIVFHILCWRHMIQLRDQTSTRSHKYFRVFNELPVLALVAIVILVVVKPAF